MKPKRSGMEGNGRKKSGKWDVVSISMALGRKMMEQDDDTNSSTEQIFHLSIHPSIQPNTPSQ